jgi:antibiotic biosynthesis monooxygenase (ABM) superfamily enzyme
MSDTRQVVVAITRKVKPGREEEFESALEEFFSNVRGEAPTEGQFFMRPASKDGSTYGILRAFKSTSDREAFYRSKTFQTWLRTVEPLVDGEPEYRELHGLEAFFPQRFIVHPPRWKMAIVTWLGVFPMVVLWANLLRPLAHSLHPVAATAFVAGFVVVSLAWAVMPLLTRLFKNWLYSANQQA